MSQIWNEVWSLPDYGTTGLVYVTRTDGITAAAASAGMWPPC
jgi:hypothetical protein